MANSLKIHFLNVGHGDCTIIDFPQRLTVVDLNNCRKFGKESEAELRMRRSRQFLPNPFLGHGPLAGYDGERALKKALDQDAARLVDPIEYIKTHFPNRSIFRYVQTHPDMDHMAGLHRLTAQERIEIVNLWDTRHSIEKETNARKWASVNFDIEDWKTYLQLRKSQGSPKALFLKADETGDYWTADGISVWAPLAHDKKSDPDADPNDFSYVLHIQFGQCSIVLGGDLAEEKWKELYQVRQGKFPKVHLLKASHHGRKSGYHLESVQAMNPDVTVVSVGELKKKDDASASYERLSNRGCYTTVDHGTLVATCLDNGVVWLDDANGKRILGEDLNVSALANLWLSGGYRTT